MCVQIGNSDYFSPYCAFKKYNNVLKHTCPCGIVHHGMLHRNISRSNSVISSPTAEFLGDLTPTGLIRMHANNALHAFFLLCICMISQLMCTVPFIPARGSEKIPIRAVRSPAKRSQGVAFVIRRRKDSCGINLFVKCSASAFLSSPLLKMRLFSTIPF